MARAAVLIGFEFPGDLNHETGEYESGGIEEHKFGADLTRLNNNVQTGNKLESDLKLDMAFQVIASKWLYSNFQWIRYIKFNGAYWTITNVQVQRPRLILQAGGIYNGKVKK